MTGVHANDTTEPPVTVGMAIEELQQLCSKPLHFDLPCYSQGVERMIQLVSQSAEVCCNKKQRDVKIRATLASRRRMPKFESKKDF